jgi:protein-S-isoprenylcysteine O-methyltransferase Ste14
MHSTYRLLLTDFPLRLKNLSAAAAVVMLSCFSYSLMPPGNVVVGRLYGDEAFSFSGGEFLVTAALTYVGLLAAYYALERNPDTSKSLRFLRTLLQFVRSPAAVWRRGLDREDRQAVLVTLLKGFFGPLMAMSLMALGMGAIAHGGQLLDSTLTLGELRSLFDRYGFWFALQVILFIDVLIFTFGYLVESPRLGNQIRSVDPTLLGWAAAMMCYPPFNKVTSAILGNPVHDFPVFEDTTMHFGLNLILLSMMTIYAAASVALGLKASNLTHRGIVARGPYAVIRHPAYVCKNIAWWIGAIPIISTQFQQSWFDGVLSTASMIGWSMIYLLRALTEEDHLRSVDGEYAAYAAKVRYRFIPGIV